MNVLITVHTYVPNNDGVEFVTKYLAEGLVNKGHVVTIITYLYPERCNVKEENINGVKVIRWNASTQHTFHKGDKIGYQKYILEHQNEFDVMVNVGTQTALTDWLMPISDQIKIPRLLYIHSIWEFKITSEDKKSLKKLIAKLWADLRWGSYYLVHGKEFKKFYCITQLHQKDYSYNFFKKRYGIESKIIENAAESDFFEQGNREKTSKYIINVSNFNKRKNQEKCIELFCNADIPDGWNLILIGSSENEYTKYLDSLIEKYKLEGKLGLKKNILILTGVERQKIYEYVGLSSLYLMTSTWEAFPISIIEAMAAGVPYISSDVGIIKYLEGGHVAHSDDEYIKLLEKYTRDDVARKRLGYEGREVALTHYRVEDKINQLESYLIELVEGKQ